MKNCLLIIICLCSLNANAYEDESSPNKAASALDGYCKTGFTKLKPIFFKKLYKEFDRIHKDFCDIKINAAELQYEIIKALKNNKSEFDPINSKQVLKNNETFYINKLISTMEFELTPRGLGNFAWKSELNEKGDRYLIHLRFQSANSIIFDNELCTVEVRKVNPNIKCTQFWKDFKEVYDAGHSMLSTPLAQEVLTHIVGLEKKWDKYYKESRSQYPWEMLINGYLFKQEKVAGQFMPPPKGNWIFLHPTAVIEDVKNAPDGENTKQSLMVEVIGYNWWQQDEWYQPSGFSVGYVYADRDETKDWGVAGAIHMNNSFTFGVSRHDDHNGVFLSIDLWKYFQSKKKLYQDYRGKIGNL